MIMRGNTLAEYDCYEDIPDDFDHVIEFLPKIPVGPHTSEQHEEIDQWNDKFLKLMEIERARSR